MQALKLSNNSGKTYMKGNAMLTDQDGLYIAQSFIPETLNNDECLIKLG